MAGTPLCGVPEVCSAGAAPRYTPKQAGSRTSASVLGTAGCVLYGRRNMRHCSGGKCLISRHFCGKQSHIH